jgi:hypothetical protein
MVYLAVSVYITAIVIPVNMLESKNSEYDMKKYYKKGLAFQSMPTDYAVDHLMNVKLSRTANTDENRSCEHPSEGTL